LTLLGLALLARLLLPRLRLAFLGILRGLLAGLSRFAWLCGFAGRSRGIQRGVECIKCPCHPRLLSGRKRRCGHLPRWRRGLTLRLCRLRLTILWLTGLWLAGLRLTGLRILRLTRLSVLRLARLRTLGLPVLRHLTLLRLGGLRRGGHHRPHRQARAGHDLAETHGIVLLDTGTAPRRRWCVWWDERR